MNDIGTAGPYVVASVNGTGGDSSVFLGNGASHVRETDFFLPLNGTDWLHQRVYSSKNSSSQNWQGEGWWGNEMMNISGTAGDEDDNDCSVEMDPHYTLGFTNTGTGTWATDDNFLYTLTYSSGDDEFILTRADGFKHVFHDLNVTNTEGKLKRIEDPYGNDWAFNYSSGQLTDIVVDVVEGTDHKITYTYFTSGDNNGLLYQIMVYKSTTTTAANMIGAVQYNYHDSTSDGDEEFGSEDDLMVVGVNRKGTNDGEGVFSIGEMYYYRYYKGTWDGDTNPGTNHQLRYTLLPENADRLNTAQGDPLTQSNTLWEDYANVEYAYTGAWVSKTQERLPGSSCGCGGAGGTPATTTYAWTENGGTPNLNTWKVQCVADREDDTRVIFEVNRLYQIKIWVVQDTDDGSPNNELIWHFLYGGGPIENRLAWISNPSVISGYDPGTHRIGFHFIDGVLYTITYDYTTDTYDGYPKKIIIRNGLLGAWQTLRAYGRTITERPDLATTVTEYESTSESNGRSTTLAYTFYDSGGDKVKPKQIDITHPSVSTAKNGPGASAVENQFFDKRTGALRWKRGGEGYVNFYAYDDETGVQDLVVVDANTSSLMQVIDANWNGNAHGGFDNDDDVPFTRTGSGTALDIDSSKIIDWLGRVRKNTDAEGMITYYAYKGDVTRVYPAWNTSTYKTLLPIRVTKTDKEGRSEDVVTLENTVTPAMDGNNEPTGAEYYENSDMATRTINTYNISGMLEHRDIYHAFSVMGTGTRYTHYYRTSYEYDDMGRQEYVIEDVADESPYDREQVTRNYYDFIGRRIKVAEGVSDNSHDITSGKPTLTTIEEYFYDDPDSDSTPEQGEGDGNLHWVRRWYGTGANDHNDTEYRFDWRNRRCLTIPPLPPYTLVKYDHLGRVTTTGTYSATTNLDPGDDPATTESGNRVGLSKAYYDEWGRVYKTEAYDDPGDATPADASVTNTYYDRRRLGWAVDGHNSGIRYTKYDGAGRRIQVFEGTQFDTNKYTSNAPDYPDDDEGIVELTDYTLNEVGNVTKTVTKELNHNDTDGMDLTNNDDYIRTYVYDWYDDAHRLIATANYGTNNSSGWKDNSTAPSYDSSPPARSDTVVVTSYTYDSEGRREKITDSKGIIALSVFDKRGRVTQREENDGGGSDERVTKHEYNARGSLAKITADLSTDQVTEYVYGSSQNARWVTKIKYPATDTDNGKTLGQPSDETYDRITFTYNADGTLATRTDQNGTVLTWSYDTLRRNTEEEVTTLGTYTGGAAAVDGAIRSITWKYNNEGRVEYVTSHTDTTPDTDNWTDAANQIKYTYNAAGKLTKVEQEEDGAVDGSTLAVEYAYGTDYTTTGNYYRRNYVEYPNGRKIWFGYTHSDTANTFQDTINDKFSRIGQIARDSGGTKGDLLAEYDFNGMGRMVRRVHDEGTGAYGNDTRMDLWHESETSGWYKGQDRFGRIVDMKHADFSGTATDFFRRKFTYDRNSNRTTIDHTLFKADSQTFTYDNLDRLTKAEHGILDSSSPPAVQVSDVCEDYSMDLLGNFYVAGEDPDPDQGITLNNGTVATITHGMTDNKPNATNEIVRIDRANAAGGALIINEPFTSTLSGFWSANKGTWGISSNTVKVNSLSSNEAVLLADPTFDIISHESKIRFPAGSSSAKAGLVLSHDGNDSYYVVIIDRSAGQIALHQVTNGSWGGALASYNVTISDSTNYTVRVQRKQRWLKGFVTGQGGFVYSMNADFGTGQVGLFSDTIDVMFDDFIVYDALSRAPGVWRIEGNMDTQIVVEESNELLELSDSKRGGEAILEHFSDDYYMVQVDVSFNGSNTYIFVRYIDTNNAYRIQLNVNGTIYFDKLENGKFWNLSTGSFTYASSVAVKVKIYDDSGNDRFKVWVDGDLKINQTDSTHAAGGVAFRGPGTPRFDNLKIGYDNNSDDDIDDAGDDIVVDEDFASIWAAVYYDHAGNMIDDGTFRYVYDAWNRLVKVQASEDSGAVTIQTAEFDGTGRRMKKVVTNSGDHDGTVVYLYDGQKIIETRDGSGNLYQQFIHGAWYIDGLVMIRVKDKGDLYVHQDANWNVIGLTDLGGSVVERYVYTPYGEVIVFQETGYGDRDGDRDVDATDKGTPGSTCTGTVSGACRILDLDFDGDYDSSDATLFDSLPQGLARHPGRIATAVHQPFGHQGLLFEPEIGQYQTHSIGQYDPMKRRFLQRDTLVPSPTRPSADLYRRNLYGYAAQNPGSVRSMEFRVTVNYEGHVRYPPPLYWPEWRLPAGIMIGDRITGSYSYTFPPKPTAFPGGDARWYDSPRTWIRATIAGIEFRMAHRITIGVTSDGYYIEATSPHSPPASDPCLLLTEILLQIFNVTSFTVANPPQLSVRDMIVKGWPASLMIIGYTAPVCDPPNEQFRIHGRVESMSYRKLTLRTDAMDLAEAR